MHLINVNTMELEFFHDDRDLVYAILSHRWQEGEVLFADMQSGHAHRKAGYAKLKRFCDEAAAADYSYAWCDTCCIDKSSSAELSESINSMFRWYQNAGVCFAYLYDLTTVAICNAADFHAEWFTRGWCLQELLAPKAMTFFNCDWKQLGTREELSGFISQNTSIHEDALGGDLEQFSVAQRMSWAATRSTTRAEDMAYSLLGIFNVNMPLLYGEGGERAFVRLQDEIMKQSPDQSIFVHSSRGAQRLLAESPADFRDSSSVVRSKPLVGEPYNLTNAGLSIELLLYSWSLEIYIALLDCCEESSNEYIGIFVQLRPQISRQGSSFSTDHATRTKVDGQAWISQPQIAALPCGQQRLYLERCLASNARHRYGFWIRQFKGTQNWAKGGRVWAVSWNVWDDKERIVELPDGVYGTVGIVVWEIDDTGDGHGLRRVARLGFTSDFAPLIEFGGDDSLPRKQRGDRPIHILSSDAFSYDRNVKQPDPSISKEDVLSDMRWTADRYDRGTGVLLRSPGRDAPILDRGRTGLAGGYAIYCRKMQVDGITTWVVDIAWQIGMEGLPEPTDAPYRSAICDCCGEVSLS